MVVVIKRGERRMCVRISMGGIGGACGVTLVNDVVLS